MSIKIKLKKVRVAYPKLAEVDSFKDESGKESVGKYSILVLLHKKEDNDLIEEIDDAIYEAGKEGGFTDKQIDALIRKEDVCMIDGETKDDEFYHDYMLLRLSNYAQPTILSMVEGEKVILKDKEEIRSSIYSGCYAYVICNIDGKTFKTPKGDKKYIQGTVTGVMFKEDGDIIGGTRASVDEFDDDDDEV